MGIKTSDMKGRTTVELKNASVWKCFPNACLPSFAPKAFHKGIKPSVIILDKATLGDYTQQKFGR